MPNFERNLRQSCTYWAPGALDSYGKRAYVAPVAAVCRWEEKAELFVARNGQEHTSKSKVFFAIPIAAEGYVALGTHTGDPEDNDAAFEVQQVYTLPDLQNLKNMYVVFL